jgi:xylulokinase
MAPTVFGKSVLAPSPAEYMALGVARQATWVHCGGPRPPQWKALPADEYRRLACPAVRERYAQVRDLLEGAGVAAVR